MQPRLIVALLSIAVILAAVVGVFWYQELRYQLPTPVPSAYKAVLAGQKVEVSQLTGMKPGKPVMLHFFNPDCPCSRFNIQHFSRLVQLYHDQVAFCAVLQVKNSDGAVARFREQYGLDIPVVLDPDRRLAEACGVYSTPQAVILNGQDQLYYRGNYNRARYCTDPQSNFAQMALDSLLAGVPGPDFPQPATRAYGCELPSASASEAFSWLK